jgi:LuxR family transcriptional regulator, maltose regulon positive regulatory protein
VAVGLALQRALLCRDGVERMWRDAREAHTTLAPGSPWVAGAMLLEGVGVLMSGDRDGADAQLARVAVVAEQRGATPTAATALAERAAIAVDRGEWGEADHLSSHSVQLVQGGGLEDYAQSALSYAVAARTAVHRGDADAARVHLGDAVRLRPKLSYALPHYAVQSLLQLGRTYVALADRPGARAVLREARDVLLIRPHLGTLGDQVAALRRGLDAVESGPIGASSLTKAELRLIPLLSTHLTYAEIGERLFVSRNTIKTQAMSIFRKLDVTSRSEAIDRIEEIGLLGR